MARWFAALWGGVALAACGDATLPEGVFVGDATDDDVVFGVVTTAQGGVAYACGGSDLMASHTRWFPLTPTSSGFVGSADGWTLDGRSTDAGWDGTLVDPDGTSLDYAVQAAESDVDGLYESDEGSCRAGAVVLDEGRRMQGVFCLPDAQPAQVVPVGQIVLESGGIRVQSDSEPPVEFVVTPAEP